jgi:hypothetical protein
VQIAKITGRGRSREERLGEDHSLSSEAFIPSTRRFFGRARGSVEAMCFQSAVEG